jgi:uncharacterized Zn-binding protein involved in type VI secretion
MPAAARIGDQTDHPGTIAGPPHVANVFIEGKPAAVRDDLHACAMPQPPAHLTTSPLVTGSGTVTIGGHAAARVTDRAQCGASIVSGASRVEIG